jgi:hypothetical protein
MDPDQPAHPRSLIRIQAVRLPTLLQVELLIANSMDPDQTGWSGFMLVANPLCWFCHDTAHIYFNLLIAVIQTPTYFKLLIK